MGTSGTLNYGRCPCGGQYESRLIEIRMTATNPPVVVSDVPQGACPSCGSRVYKAETLERIEALLKGSNVDGRLNRPERWLEADMFGSRL